jgi:hypothetical protein
MIIVKCDCGEQFNVERTKEIPDDTIHIECNWCPICEDTAEEDYYERYISKQEEKEIPNPNQTELF